MRTIETLRSLWIFLPHRNRSLYNYLKHPIRNILILKNRIDWKRTIGVERSEECWINILQKKPKIPLKVDRSLNILRVYKKKDMMHFPPRRSSTGHRSDRSISIRPLPVDPQKSSLESVDSRRMTRICSVVSATELCSEIKCRTAPAGTIEKLILFLLIFVRCRFIDVYDHFLHPLWKEFVN